MFKPHPEYFGVDFASSMLIWWNTEFLPSIRQDFGNDPFTVVVLKPRSNPSWENPLGDSQENILLQMSAGEASKIDGPEGLTANVEHKLHNVLGTGKYSSEVKNFSWLVEPGDFPYSGAGSHKGFVGGVSGFDQYDDWIVFKRFVDKLVELRIAAVASALEACNNRVPGMKYLLGTPVPQG